ncbi:DNA polymerase II small subunit [Thermogymnomonas acidicola]|uniref:DNA polymerase II small subunit n=1 Tax=Thermogymnomonas acidicola TaxID=399579 RepID=A0AA37BPY0_9ARCH|nr:DNA-directed DNA polymerase II small subunit [Thermogymnomonas acidicola]GGM68313.1 DNA polymerase II small subunit [Thermogymnomonas acidicola]
MESLFEDRAGILKFFNSHGILVSPGALNLILQRSMGQMIPHLLTDEVQSSGYIDEKTVLRLIRGEEKVPHVEYEVSLPDIRVNSSVEDFRKMFVSRYEKLKKIIVTSSTMRGSVDIKTAKRSQGEVKVVGMVQSVEVTRNGHKKVTIEDLEDTIQVILMKDRGLAGELILNDEVIGVIGSVGRNSSTPVIFANEVVRPDIPMRVMDDTGKPPVYVASVSDIHVGSKTFRRDDFRSMVKWISSSREEAESLRYLIMSGDVVDGIGVYPGQENDLELLNPLEQYEALAELVSEIPEDITIFLMPGNHDSVRLAEPQPVFSHRIRELFPRNVVMLPNPYNLRLEGKNVLIYHGMSLNDMVELIPGVNFQTIGKAIEEILKRRHLVPSYGGKTPLIPSENDYHVIEEVPDIFITGHIHSHYLGNYRGVRYVNSSTWQSQTEYQKMMNFSPNPSILTLFDLNSSSTLVKRFSKD